jgi:hypothetical protein
MRVTPNLKQVSVRKFAQPLNLDLYLLRFCTQRLVFLPLAPPVLQPRYPAGFCFSLPETTGSGLSFSAPSVSLYAA